MTAGADVGLLSLLFVLAGIALVAAAMFAHLDRRKVERRVDLATGSADIHSPRTTELATPRMRKGGELFRNAFCFGMPRKWGVKMRPEIVLLVALASAAATWFACQTVFGLPRWLAFPLAAAGFVFVPQFLLRMQQGRADRAFLEHFPSAIDMIVRMLRAGLPMSAAISVVGREAPAPVNEVFHIISDQLTIGLSFEDAVGRAGRRVGLPDFGFFASAVALQRVTGGNVANTLAILSDIIRKRHVLQVKARAATAEVRISAYILGAIPLFVVGALLITSPSYLSPLLTDPRGNVIITAAVVMLISAFVVMRQMMASAIRT